MPVDKFGNEVSKKHTMKTTDGGVSIAYANQNNIRTDGESVITGNLDMSQNSIKNLKNPEDGGDAVTKDYIDKK